MYTHSPRDKPLTRLQKFYRYLILISINNYKNHKISLQFKSFGLEDEYKTSFVRSYGQLFTIKNIAYITRT